MAISLGFKTSMMLSEYPQDPRHQQGAGVAISGCVWHDKIGVKMVSENGPIIVMFEAHAVSGHGVATL